MIDIEGLARAQSLKTKDSLQLWQQEIEKASELSAISELTDGEFNKVISASSSVSIYKSVTTWLNEFYQIQTSPSGFDLLAQYVDESEQDLSQWLEALHIVRRWIEKTGERQDLPRCLGYIKCTSMKLSQSGEGSLGVSLEEMLEEFGFESLES